MHFDPQMTCLIPWEKNSRKELIHNVDECGVILVSSITEFIWKMGFSKGTYDSI